MLGIHRDRHYKTIHSLSHKLDKPSRGLRPNNTRPSIEQDLLSYSPPIMREQTRSPHQNASRRKSSRLTILIADHTYQLIHPATQQLDDSAKKSPKCQHNLTSLVRMPSPRPSRTARALVICALVSLSRLSAFSIFTFLIAPEGSLSKAGVGMRCKYRGQRPIRHTGRDPQCPLNVDCVEKLAK